MAIGKEETFRELTELGIVQNARRLVEMGHHSAILTSHSCEMQELEMGASRLGGWPDVPRGFAWPRWRGGPLDFLLQLRLADLSREGTGGHLPASGVLYLFYDVREWDEAGTIGADPDSWHLFHHAGETSDLVRTEPPFKEEECHPHSDEGRRHLGGFRPCRITQEYQFSIPSPFSGLIKGRLDPREEDALFDELFDKELLFADRDFCYDEMVSGYHRLLGHADGTNYCLEHACVLNVRKYAGLSGITPGEADDWRLLLQVDIDTNAGMIWPEVSKLNFMIKSGDLANADFSKCWLVFECS